ncbi:MAG: sulfotransferase domain-containing protein [Oculatellaceae cyanobacterium Prado106]|jgi:hypothetical protein|nr:sulfotransferase domain-containing protein [Oculatellaceae cyanobacterium Prado106]
MTVLSRKLIHQIRPIAQKFLPQQDTTATVLDKVAFVPGLADWYADRYVGTYLVSFPKCGVTWLRLMIGKTLEKQFAITHPDALDLIGKLDEGISMLHPDIPRIRVKHDDEPHKKTPEQLTTDKSSYRYAKVIFLARDPRDVMASAYAYAQQRPEFHKIQEPNLSAYLRSAVGSFDTLLTYYNIWAANQQIPRDFLLIRYEDMRTHPHQALRQVLDFLNLQTVPDETLDEVIEFTSFANMRNLEEKKVFSTLMQGFDANQQSSYHVRKGKVGGFKEEMSPEDIQFLNSRMEQILTQAAWDLYQFDRIVSHIDRLGRQQLRSKLVHE